MKSLFRVKDHKLFLDIGLVITLTCVLLILIFPHIIFDPFYYFAADIKEMYFPWWVFINRSIRSLNFPAMNHYWFLGSLPFAAIDSGVFYLPLLLIQFLFDAAKDPDKAYLFLLGVLFTHYILAAMAMYLFSRKGLKLYRLTAVFSALVYVGSGAFIGRFTHIYYIMQLAWLPLFFLSYFLFLEKGGLVRFIITSIVLSIIINIGHPQITFYILLFYFLAVLYFTFTCKSQNRFKILISSFLIIILAFLFSSPKLLLSFEFSQYVTRIAPEMSLKNLYNSIPPVYFLTLLLPDLFGRHIVGYWGTDIPYGNWENYLYIGILPLFLMLFCLWWKNKRVLWFFLLSLFLTVILGFGKYFPLTAYLYKHFPYADNFVIVSRIFDLFHFFIVVLSAIGLQAILERKSGKKRITLSSAVIIVIGLVVLFWPIARLPGLGSALGNISKTAGINLAIGGLLYFPLIFILSLIGLGLILISRKRFFVLLLIGIFMFDVHKTSSDFNPIEKNTSLPSSYFGITDETKILKQDQSIFRVHNLWPRNINMIQGIESTFGYHTIRTKAYDILSGRIEAGDKKTLDMLNVKYIIDDMNLNFPLDKTYYQHTGGNLWLNPSYLPRLYFVSDYQLTDGLGRMKEVFASGDFNPKETVLLDKSLVSDVKVELPKKPVKKNDSLVIITGYSGDGISAKVITDKPGFLVFGQPQYPGWTASMDGKKQALLPANLAIYVLPITKGQHDVIIQYVSKPFQYGMIISGITLVLIIFIAANKRTRGYFNKKLAISST